MIVDFIDWIGLDWIEENVDVVLMKLMVECRQIL
jgi:hypothetical protein